jgi:hypothetical protein
MKNVIMTLCAVVCLFVGASAQAQGRSVRSKQPCEIEEYTQVKKDLDAARKSLAALPDFCKPDETGKVKVVAGTPGQRGRDGVNGHDGKPGVDGKSPAVSKIEMGVGVTECGGRGGVKVVAPNGALALFICNGKDGADGKSVTVEPEAAGVTCPNGGIVLTLSDNPQGYPRSESSYVCNGKDGRDGRDGRDGKDGKDAAQSSSAMALEAGLGVGLAFRGEYKSYEGDLTVGLNGWLWKRRVGLGVYGSGGICNSTTVGMCWHASEELGLLFGLDEDAEFQIMTAFAADQYWRDEAELNGLAGYGLGYRIGGKIRFRWEPDFMPIVVSPSVALGTGPVSGYYPDGPNKGEPFNRSAVQAKIGLDISVAVPLL